jgi:surfeit locus 1 family protein
MSETVSGGGAWRRPRVFGAVLLTVVGTAILLSLMTWQIRRLAWKEDLIATLEARLEAAPMPLPESFDREADEFRRVAVTGRFTGETGAHGFADAAYLTTQRPHGPGYRVIQPFETEHGRRLLVDRGYVPVAAKNEGAAARLPTPYPAEPLTLTAALRWPQEADFFADEDAGRADNVWLTRNVEALAPLWGAEPVLLVAETATATGEGRFPLPLRPGVNLPNDHLEYAVTWGGMALVWSVMGGVLVRREWRRVQG